MSRRNIAKIKKKAASQAINKTVSMLEQKFNIEAEGSKPTQKRKDIIKKLEKKFRKLKNDDVNSN